MICTGRAVARVLIHVGRTSAEKRFTHSFAGWRIHRDAFLPSAKGDGEFFFAHTEDAKCPQGAVFLGDPPIPPSSLSKVSFQSLEILGCRFYPSEPRLLESDFFSCQQIQGHRRQILPNFKHVAPTFKHVVPKFKYTDFFTSRKCYYFIQKNALRGQVDANPPRKVPFAARFTPSHLLSISYKLKCHPLA